MPPSPRKVFIVESDAGWRDRLKDTIATTFGDACSVETYESFTDGWQALSQSIKGDQVPALIIAGDDQSAGMHQGLRFAQILTESDKTKARVGLLVVTEQDYLEMDMKRNENVTAFFGKNQLKLDDLLSTVAKALGISHTARLDEKSPPDRGVGGR